MTRIALIGESPYDTTAIASLLINKYGNEYSFFPLIGNFRGGNLDNVKADSVVVNQLKFEYKDKKPDFVIYFRDLDHLETNHLEHNRRLTSMYELAAAVCQNAVFMLCIFELESLILVDLDTFNNKFGTNLIYPDKTNLPPDPDDPMQLFEPKEYLMGRSSYRESDCPELFSNMHFDKLLTIRFFAEFISNFENRLGILGS